MKPSRIVVVGAAWYGDWARLFTEALRRIEPNTQLVYNNSLPETLGGSNAGVTTTFEKAKIFVRKVSPALFAVLKKWRQWLSDREILARVGRVMPGERVLVIFTWTPGSVRVLKTLRKKGVMLILWQGEPTARDASWEPKFDYFDHLFMVDDGHWADILSEKNKKRVQLLPLAGDETIFYPLKTHDERYAADVVFIGKYFAHKAKTLEGVKDHDLKIYGYGWEAGFEQFPWLKEKYFGPLPTEALNAVYNSTKVAAGTMGTPNDPFTTATMRTFDIALAGTFQVSETSYLARKLFGDTIGLSKDDADFKRLVDHYLAHDEERKDRAARSREIALRYTYSAAAKKIIAVAS